MTTQSKNFETSGERIENSPYIPPFGLIGISSDVVLNEANPDDYRAKQAWFYEQGDTVVAFIDCLDGIARSSDEDSMDMTLPDMATVADHLAVSRPKIESFLRGRSTSELVDEGVYIGPYIVSVIDGNTLHPVDCVRLAIYQRNTREDI